MRAAALSFAPILALVVLLAGARARAQDEGEWEPYAASAWGMSGHAFLNDWYVLNKLEPLADETEAGSRHYYDRGSLASNAFEGAGGTIRVWEKILFDGTTRPYAEVRAEVEKEEEQRLGRPLTVIDMARVFPHAVNQATKEIRTLFEINCESGEFIVLEVNLYDVEGGRMISEKNANVDLWYAIRPGTVMSLLAGKACARGPL